MYGVPGDLNLTFLGGATLIQVCLGEYQVQFHFHPEGYIGVEGAWTLAGAEGDVLDHGDRDVPRAKDQPYQLHRLLGQRVISYLLDPPRSFALQFEGGETLRIYDDSDTYESFSIQPGDIYV